ncbi:TetR/AcrR family transcriptional regulator [Aeromicrobium wangtongii]|uniref:TetR/AcrR family transcriptional regulator n=1 Tax=Aeromicrobium wangtongii TaxID=2969247 RepID=UPI002016CF2E|nr:TetR family transcriptional regulator [Aeromicrobium wangtongii]MCL3819978.1 TetR family transcriptional regulator [Aeromicrobium wangtongii]
MTTFQRARSEEQREIRRQAILDVAATMLTEMPVADLTLNELSRRVGLAKSNVLRYFESREAVLLELMHTFLEEVLEELADQMATGIDPDLPPERRAEQLADVLSQSLSAHPVLCDLFGAQSAVLERNVSVEVAIRHKRASLDTLGRMDALVRRHLPELGDNTRSVCLLTMIMAGALSVYFPPPASVAAAYEADPSLEQFDDDLCMTLRTAVLTGLVGGLPRG